MQNSPVSRQARADAAAWLARLRADDRSAADEQAFHAWLAANPEHMAAFDAVNMAWDLAGACSQDLRGMPTAPERGIARRALLAGACVIMATGGSVLFWQSAQADVYQTEIGEQKHVSLSDGTQVFLDTATRIRVSFSKTRRLLELDYGRANIQVAADAKRPFAVRVAERLIAVNHATLDVSRESDRISVLVLQGDAIAATGTGRINPGERLTVAPGGTRLDKPNLTPLLAWQTGQAIFENTSLTEAVHEMNRYSTVRLVVTDSTIANLKVSGVYRAGDNAAFARSISKLLPVEVHEAADHIDLVADISRTAG